MDSQHLTLRQFVGVCRVVVEAYSPELAAETVIAFTRPRHRRRYLMPSGAIIMFELVGVEDDGPAVVHDVEILPPPDDPAWRGRVYYVDDDEASYN